MNNLSVLRGPYIQNMPVMSMTEQKLIQTSDNQTRFEGNPINWQDIQGLSWFFCEDCNQTKESIKTSFACA